MVNKILKILFGWCYDFDTQKDKEEHYLSDEEAKYVDKNFNKIPIWKRR